MTERKCECHDGPFARLEHAVEIAKDSPELARHRLDSLIHEVEEFLAEQVGPCTIDIGALAAQELQMLRTMASGAHNMVPDDKERVIWHIYEQLRGGSDD